MAGNSAQPGRSVISKVVAILLTFHDGSQHSLTEIARLTGLPVSTTHRLVTELACWGLLERTDESQFRAGLPIRSSDGRGAYSPAIIESARWVLEDLVVAARGTARLGVLTGTRVAYIEKRCGSSPVTTFVNAPRLPAHATALGKALLAFSPAAVQQLVLAEKLARYSPSTVTDPEQLRQSLSVIRLTCFAVSRSEFEDGSWVAVPVFGAGRAVVAALGLSVPNLRTDLHLARSVLTIAASGLSRELTSGTSTRSFRVEAEQAAAIG